MKNHIKNYIKIMGLAAVPFGTAQVHGITEYKIEVKKKETDKVRHFPIGVKCFSEKKCFLRPEVIEIDWPKSNDAVPVRVSKHDAKSIFRFCDVVTKNNAALYYDNKKLVRGSVHVLSFWVRKFPFKSNEPFTEALRCDLIFNPNPGEKQEGALLVLEELKDFPCIVSVLSDMPTYMQGRRDFMLITNHLCPFDKLPLFIRSSGFLPEESKRYVIVNDSVPPMTDKEMRKAVKGGLFVACEGGHIIGIAGGGRFIGRKEFQEEHSDYFEVQDAFSSDLIKDGKVYVSDNLKIGEAVFLKIHNNTDGVISYERSLFIEPHGMVSIFFENFYGSGFLDLKKAGNDWGTKVWIECPNGKSPKAYNFFTKREIENEKHKQRMLELMKFNANKNEREILEALREKDPKDWIKTILEFGKKPNAVDKNEIKIKDKREEPKIEEKKEEKRKGKKHLKKGKAPKKIKKDEMMMKKDEDPFEDGEVLD